MAKQHLPIFTIRDLTIPGMDGFDLVQGLKPGPRANTIPIIVVGAKDSTPAEWKRCNGYIEAV